MARRTLLEGGLSYGLQPDLQRFESSGFLILHNLDDSSSSVVRSLRLNDSGFVLAPWSDLTPSSSRVLRVTFGACAKAAAKPGSAAIREEWLGSRLR